jgi:diaminopimelate decarboxylase
MNEKIIAELAEKNDSFYLYDEGEIRSRANKLKHDISNAGLLYSIKANPDVNVVKCLAGIGFGADAASAGEVETAAAAGIPAADIYYSAPGKTDSDLQQTLGRCVIIADSIGEIGRINKRAAAEDLRVDIGLRINPDFHLQNDPYVSPCCRPSKFGIDMEAALEVLSDWGYDRVRVTGIHIHLGSQMLDHEMIEAYHENVLKTAVKTEETMGRALDFINLGSGIGIPYGSDEAEADTAAIGRNLRRLAERYGLGKTRLIMETGRYVAGPAGIYACKVIDRKESGGRIFVILAGTLNGFIRPSMARLIENCAGGAPVSGCEPLFNGNYDGFRPETLKKNGETEIVTLVGNLCTAIDVVAESAELPEPEPGDVVFFRNAGAYGAVLSPRQFASQPQPKEFFVTAEGRVIG